MRELRRRDRKTTDEEARRILAESEYGTLAMTDENGDPYCIPICTALVGDTLYFHCAKMGGYKNELLVKHPRVCYSCVLQQKNLPEQFTQQYASCVAVGNARFVTDETERMTAIRAIAEKYSAPFMDTPAYDRTMRSMPAVLVVAIDVEDYCGKANKGKLDV